MAALSLRDEVTELLRELVRLDTVNPPGNETRAAELLRGYLEPRGVECQLLARVAERANLVARISGRDPLAPRLLFLSHTDTVLADPAEWSVDPWAGELRDGYVWGRGALDMKGQVAASAVALAALAAEGFVPEGDLLFAATADEEVGNGFGVPWLCDAHPDSIRAAWCVNEGGGDRIVVAGRSLYLCGSSEKATAPFRVRVRGRAGHASMPDLGDNALVKAASLIEPLGSLEFPATMTPETAAFLAAVTGDELTSGESLDWLRRAAPRAAAMIEPMLRTTIAPTMIRASEKRNVIPALCEIECDCRLLPDDTPERVGQRVRETLGDGDWELDWPEGVTGGSRSALHTPLWDAIQEFVEAEEPGAIVAPVLLPGFTDSHYLRRTFGTIAYGFFPMRAMDPELAALLVHSADERADVDDLELGVRFLMDTARALLG